MLCSFRNILHIYYVLRSFKLRVQVCEINLRVKIRYWIDEIIKLIKTFFFLFHQTKPNFYKVNYLMENTKRFPQFSIKPSLRKRNCFYLSSFHSACLEYTFYNIPIVSSKKFLIVCFLL